MANLAGKTTFTAPAPAPPASIAVDEWARRTAVEAPPPRNTLRGRQHAWKPAPLEPVLNDPGPLHISVAFNPALDYSLCRGEAAKAAAKASPKPIAGRTTATAELARGDWEQRVAQTLQAGGLRGSQTPNFKPQEQVDLTHTGSVNPTCWAPGTTNFHRPGTTTLADIRAGLQTQEKGCTWSTAALSRAEWEERLAQGGIGNPL